MGTLVTGVIAEFRQEVQAATTPEAPPLVLEKLDTPGNDMDLPDEIGAEWNEISSETQWRIQEAGRQLEARFGPDLGKFFVLDGLDPKYQVLAVTERTTSGFNVVWAFKTSAGKKGFGNVYNSGKTSTGVFKMGAVDGRGGEIGIIRDRVDYGERVGAPNQGTPTIVTRFIPMIGLDEANKNAQSRQIGIHGTNYPARLGTKDSGGCVRVDDGAAIILSALVTNKTDPTYMIVINPEDPQFSVPASERGKKISMAPKPGEEEISVGPWGNHE